MASSHQRAKLSYIQKDVEFRAGWNNQPNFLRHDFRVRDVHIFFTPLSSEDYEGTLAISSALIKSGQESTYLSLQSHPIPNSEELAISIQVNDSLKSFLKEAVPRPFLRIQGYLFGDRRRYEYGGEVVLHQKTFDVSFDLSDPLLPLGSGKLVEISPVRLEENERIVPIIFRLTISVEWGKDPPKAIKLGEEKVLKALFEDEESKDIILEAEGKEIKCHRFVLGANSQVFRRMFAPENRIMVEGANARMEVEDMSFKCLEKLIKLFYCQQVEFKDLSCELTVELFQAAHKYQVEDLEEGLKEKLMAECESWYGAEGLLQLYAFVRNVEFHKDLEEHVIDTIKKMADVIKDCDYYKDLKKSGIISEQLLF